MAILLNEDGDGKILVVKNCATDNQPFELTVFSQRVGSSDQHYRIQCYVDGTFDLNGAVQVYTQVEFDAEFGQGDFTWDDVDGGELAIIFGMGVFMASSVYLMAWGCRKLIDMVQA